MFREDSSCPGNIRDFDRESLLFSPNNKAVGIILDFV
jgi:hypothetical protein